MKVFVIKELNLSVLSHKYIVTPLMERISWYDNRYYWLTAKNFQRHIDTPLRRRLFVFKKRRCRYAPQCL